MSEPQFKDLNSRDHRSYHQDPEDSTRTARKVITINPDGSDISRYKTNDIEDAGSDIFYFGKEDKVGDWLIIRIDESGNPDTYQYATESNNSLYTDYSTAWINRATLTYNDYSTAF